MTAERTRALETNGHFLVKEWVLANVREELLTFVLFALPPLNVITSRLILQSLQYLLVLPRDLDELSLTRLAVQTPTACAGSSASSRCTRLQCDGVHGYGEWWSRVDHAGRVGREKRATLLLKNVRHFLEQYAVLSFDLGVPLYIVRKMVSR